MWFKTSFIFCFFLLISPELFAQTEVKEEKEKISVDSLYREDQFYVGATYNFLVNRPTGLINRGLSGGIRGGYFRDFPVNKRRNVAIAIGIGMAYDQFGHNFFIGEDEEGKTIFRTLDEDVDYTSNRFNMAIVEVPIEFRWRTSTPSDYRFWRIYGGARIGYAYWYKSFFSQEGNRVIQTKIPEFNPVRISAYASFGYSTFNFFGSYSFTPFFKEGFTESGESVSFNAVQVGLIFYIL